MSSSNDPSSTPPVASGGPGPSFEPVGGSYYGSTGGAPPSPAATPARPPQPSPVQPSPVSRAADPYSTSGAPTPADPRGAVPGPHGQGPQQGASGYGQGPQPVATPYGAPSASPAPYGQGNNIYGQPPAPGAQPGPYANPYGQGAPGYGQPPNPYGAYGPAGGDIYGVYGYQGPTKSKAVAALLAFFLGGFGVHNFYLGQMGRGFGHLAIAVAGMAGLVSTGVAISSNPSADDFLFVLILVFYLLPMANGIWAFVEFIIILIKPEHELGR